MTSAGLGKAAAAAVAVGIALLAPALPAASAANMPSGFRDSVVLSEVAEPTAIDFASDGHIFVAQKTGKVLVYSDVDDTTPTVFADLRTDVYDGEDRGMLGLAVDPDFPQRPYVYVLYVYDHILGDPNPAPRWGEPDHEGDQCTEPKGADSCLASGRLVRLTAEGEHAVAELPLIEDWCQQFSTHSPGDIEFGVDGSLYASAGDAASFNASDYGQFGTPPNPCGDPAGEGGALRSQDLRTLGDPAGLDGSVIRVDPDTGEGLLGNPMFASADPNARRIVAYGFRNPFRFAIDPSSGEVYVANVGWNLFEEIDRFPATPNPPYNSGWPCSEGLGPTPGYSSLELDLCQSLPEGPGGASPPFFLYRHGANVVPEDGCPTNYGSALSAIAFYESGSYPSAYDGALFFTDPVRGCFFVMFPGDDGRPDATTTKAFATGAGIYPGVDLKAGPGGDLFYVKLFGDIEEGTIHRISYEPDAPVARLSADPRWGADDPLEVHLDASPSTDPQGESLSFKWDLDEDGAFETSGSAQRTEMVSGGEAVKLAVQVSDETGKKSIDRVTVYPGDTPPQPEIVEPGASLSWGVGQEIHFEGAADDAEDGELEDEQLYWRVRLYHCPDACHAHLLRLFPGVDEGDFAPPDHDYPSHIEISLTAADSEGLTATEPVSIDARALDLQIESNPPGIELSAGQISGLAPFDLKVIDGSGLTLAAPRTATVGGHEYFWSGWSDGGDRVHEITAKESRAYTVSYVTGDPPGRRLPRPRTRLRRRPAKLTERSRALFAFTADRGRMHFKCRLDRAPYAFCRSPRVYEHLRPGRHAFRVFALDALGGADLSPVVFRWRVLCPKPPEADRPAIATPLLPACARPGGSAAGRGR